MRIGSKQWSSQIYQCDYGEVIVKPQVHFGHSSCFESQTEGQKGRYPSDADGCINIGLQPGHDVEPSQYRFLVSVYNGRKIILGIQTAQDNDDEKRRSDSYLCLGRFTSGEP